jgi:hypothetical protein
MIKRLTAKISDFFYSLPRTLFVDIYRLFIRIRFFNKERLPIERSLRAKIQHHDKVAYCFMGSKRHLLDGLFLDKNKPLYRIAKFMPLNKIPAEKFKIFIRSRFKSVDMVIEGNLIDQISGFTV